MRKAQGRRIRPLEGVRGLTEFSVGHEIDDPVEEAAGDEQTEALRGARIAAAVQSHGVAVGEVEMNLREAAEGSGRTGA